MKRFFIAAIVLLMLITGCGLFFLPSGISFQDIRYQLQYRRAAKQSKQLSSFPVLKLELPHRVIRNMEKARVEALNAGFLLANARRGGKGLLCLEKEKYAIKIKLKGRLKDHWSHPLYWSFKVKLDSGKFLGLTQFDLMPPARRYGADEWLYHRLLAQCGLPYLKYKLVELYINNWHYGVYAIEQNPMKVRDSCNVFYLDFNQLIVNGSVQRTIENRILGHFDNSLIESEELFSTLSVKSGKGDIFTETGRTRLEGFQNRSTMASELFDTNEIGKLLALTTLFGNPHPFTIANARFLNGCKGGKFQLVPYDLEGIEPVENIWKYIDDKGQTNQLPVLVRRLLQDSLVAESYTKALIEYSSVGWLEYQLKQCSEELAYIRENLPPSDFGQTNDSLLLANARIVRMIMAQKKPY